MSNRKVARVLVVALAMVLVCFFSLGAAARIELAKPVLAELYGSYDLNSAAPVTVIVELTEASVLEAKHAGRAQDVGKLAKVRDKAIADTQAMVQSAQVVREYEHVFSGFALKLPANEIPQLLAVPGISAVYPSIEYTITGSSIGAEESSPLMAESAPFIGADVAWALGYTGAGVTVAVIDTGVDYTHPDLVHAFADYKGWDFVDNDADPQETPPGDPRGEETTHGTHVAGTIAANGVIKGIAPEATLLAYRVLGPGGSGSTENVIAGVERAVLDGADVMNLSLGNTLNSPDWATSIALDNAMRDGVVAVTANGNSGPANWTVGSPGASRRAISVGATQLPYNEYDVSIFTTDAFAYPSAEIMGWPSENALVALDGNSYEFVWCGLGAATDFVGIDVEGKIALIVRGEYAFVEKVENAKNAGAVGAIIFNNVAGRIPFYIPGMELPTVKLTLEDGQKMLAELAAGNNTVAFDLEWVRYIGESLAEFSSRGPAMDTWMIKPDVCAPGVNITSTIPTHDPEDPWGYAAFQGTSMSSPHVAGAAALLLEANPGWDVDDVKAALMNTAVDIEDPDGGIYPHNSQGAGSIRIDQALATQTLVIPGSHSFGVFDKDSGKQTERQHFTIKNLSATRVRYDISVDFAGDPEGIKVSTSNNAQVNAGKSHKVNMVVQVDASKLAPGYYEGVITVNGNGQEIKVPTILFVQEPDYPRITHFGVDTLAEGYELWAYLPGGADLFEVWVYRDTPWGYVGDAVVTYDVPAGFYEHMWDGTINGQQLPTGFYHVYGYAEKAGLGNYVYGGYVYIP